MSLIITRGTIPTTPHTEQRNADGSLALESIHGSYGFSGPWSRRLHLRSYPTEQVAPPTRADFDFVVGAAPEVDCLQPFMIQTSEMPTGGDALRARTPIILGATTRVSIVKPTSGFPANEFFRNGENYEIYYTQAGAGVCHSEYGVVPFRKETYLIIPKGTTYRLELTTPSAWMLLIESKYPIEWPPHYVNHGGQSHLSSPVFESEIETPALPPAQDLRGKFAVFTQHGGGRVTRMTLGHHPFDVVGWEGAMFPFVFDINHHHGITRQIHAEPPQHNTFQSGNVPHNGFSICSFVPQQEGWHPKDIPAPYAHLNVDSDELMFFCNANYGARKGMIQEGSFTFHPGAVPHSPHGKAAEKSLAARGKFSQRLAVMLDTYFESVQITPAGYQFRDPTYATSWNEANWTDQAAADGTG